MKKFRVIATMYTDLEVIIEAENADEAYRIAREDMDGSDYTECPHSGDWVVGDVFELDGKGETK